MNAAVSKTVMGGLRPSRVRIPPPPLNDLAVGDPRAGSRPAEPDESREDPAARRVPAPDPADQRAGRGLRQGRAGADPRSRARLQDPRHRAALRLRRRRPRTDRSRRPRAADRGRDRGRVGGHVRARRATTSRCASGRASCGAPSPTRPPCSPRPSRRVRRHRRAVLAAAGRCPPAVDPMDYVGLAATVEPVRGRRPGHDRRRSPRHATTGIATKACTGERPRSGWPSTRTTRTSRRSVQATRPRRRAYLEIHRPLLGWAIFVGRVRRA